MSTHTPGPWEVQKYVVDRDGNEVGAWSRGSLTVRARIVTSPDDEGGSMIIASMVAGGPSDARLIAAAPEMLEALHRCVLALEVATTPLAEDREEVRSARELALKVIAKAEGRS